MGAPIPIHPPTPPISPATDTPNPQPTTRLPPKTNICSPSTLPPSNRPPTGLQPPHRIPPPPNSTHRQATVTAKKKTVCPRVKHLHNPNPQHDNHPSSPQKNPHSQPTTHLILPFCRSPVLRPGDRRLRGDHINGVDGEPDSSRAPGSSKGDPEFVGLPSSALWRVSWQTGTGRTNCGIVMAMDGPRAGGPPERLFSRDR